MDNFAWKKTKGNVPKLKFPNNTQGEAMYTEVVKIIP
jgi:hypothetical protein